MSELMETVISPPESIAVPVHSPGVKAVPQQEKRKKSKRLSREDIEMVAALEAVRSDMEFLHNCFDETTEPILVDSLIYELKAANLKYQYYIGQCKLKGIVCGDIPELRG